MSHQPDIGRRILEESFAIIERELGPHNLPPWAFAVVRRMIHASADFDFAQTVRYSDDFEFAVRTTLHSRVTAVPHPADDLGRTALQSRPDGSGEPSYVIVTDTEMVRIGIQAAAAMCPGVTLVCHLNDSEVRRIAEASALTRSAAGIRLAARRYVKPLLAIGNAPTALDETLRLIEEGWRPAAIVGIPVGFVGVEEAKQRLLNQSRVPYLTCIGRKGGSAVTAAAVNALIELGPVL